jgi:hydroxyethylthiazole kinase-like sugar kinase family protein
MWQDLLILGKRRFISGNKTNMVCLVNHAARGKGVDLGGFDNSLLTPTKARLAIG